MRASLWLRSDDEWEKVLNNFVFHLGLMEIPSYWKATCSPEIIVEAGSLGREQIQWWRDLIIKGMGQFFYENKIDWRQNFLEIKAVCSENEIFQIEPPFRPAGLTAPKPHDFKNLFPQFYVSPLLLKNRSGF